MKKFQKMMNAWWAQFGKQAQMEAARHAIYFVKDCVCVRGRPHNTQGNRIMASTAVSKTACWGSSPYSPAKVSFLIFIKKYVIIFM